MDMEIAWGGMKDLWRHPTGEIFKNFIHSRARSSFQVWPRACYDSTPKIEATSKPRRIPRDNWEIKNLWELRTLASGWFIKTENRPGDQWKGHYFDAFFIFYLIQWELRTSGLLSTCRNGKRKTGQMSECLQDTQTNRQFPFVC